MRTFAWERVAVAAFLLISAASPSFAQTQGPRPRPEVIYGNDDRVDLYQVNNPKVRELADSTVALFPAGRVSDEGGKARLGTEVYGERMGLCKEEPFYPQPMGAFCSGSLVGPDLIMTAGHCITSQDSCEDTKFVFGFAVTKEGEYPASVPGGDVYGCAKLLGRVEEGRGADWALIRLDRPVSGHKPLQVNRSGALKKGTPLFVIGHPAGLPTKVAGGAVVRDPSPNGYFVANLDTYGGNSGSAVFNASNGLVEGILVRGELDYVWKDGCRVSNVCADDACRGEDVTKVGALASQIPPSGIEAAFARPGAAALSLLDMAGGGAGSLGLRDALRDMPSADR